MTTKRSTVWPNTLNESFALLQQMLFAWFLHLWPLTCERLHQKSIKWFERPQGAVRAVSSDDRWFDTVHKTFKDYVVRPQMSKGWILFACYWFNKQREIFHVIMLFLCFDPFTAPGWKMHGCVFRQYIFLSCNTSIFSAMHLDKNPFTCQCESEEKKA